MSTLPNLLPKPKVLLLGEILIAHAEWESLAAIAELRVCTRPNANPTPTFDIIL